MKVLYLVGEDDTSSIPLELARGLSAEDVKVVIAAYYSASTFRRSVDFGRIEGLGASGQWDLRAVLRLTKLIHRLQPDVLHVHHTVSSFWGALVGKVLAGTMIVRTEHDDHRYYSVGQNVVNALSEALADRVIVNSDDTYENLLAWQKKLVDGKWTRIYNGVDIGRIDRAREGAREMRRNLLQDEGEILVAAVGRFIRQKNFKTLVDAMSMVLEDYPEARLVLVGDGAKRSLLERRTEKLGIGDQVTFFGIAARDDVYRVLHAVDLFVVPSLWEGFCNAAVEGMAAATPIVVSDISTLREVVGPPGVYVDPEDPASIATGIRSVLDGGEAKRARLGREVRHRANERYRLKDTREKYRRVYRNLFP